MKIDQVHKTYISKAFYKLDSKEDLLLLLNYAKGLIYGSKTVPFELKQLTYYSNPRISANRYVQLLINKKSGGVRLIHAPTKGLKSLQQALNVILHCVFTPHKAACGFVDGKSVVDNASLHVGSNYVYNIDLEDFFHSIDQARIWKCFQNKPFHLNSRQQNAQFEFLNSYSGLGVDAKLKIESKQNEVVNIISALSCTKISVTRKNQDGKLFLVEKNVLPQGAPTSPIISNIVCQRLDFLLNGVAKRFGLRYSRYADDITFSSLHNVYQSDSDFIVELRRIIEEQGFRINSQKTRLQKQGYRQEVTGVLVNEKVNLQKQYVKTIRMWLYYLETYGLDKAETIFLSHYKRDKGYIKKSKPSMLNVIVGKLNYLKMIKGSHDTTYRKLLERFNELIEENEQEDEIDLSRHKPLDISNFLKNFKTSYGLKFLTHDYDVPNNIFSREKIIKIARREFIELTTKLSITTNLYAKVNQFAFGSPNVAWWAGKKKHYLNWNSPDLINWTIKNPNLHPILNDKFNSLMIAPFKQSIEIKSPQLEELIKRRLAKSLGSLYTAFDISENTFKDLDKANFYTDVDSLEVGLGYLFNSIKQRSHNSKKLRIEFYRVPNLSVRTRVLKIVHVGSECDKPLSKDELFQGDFIEAEKAFFGICDWSIVAKSPDNTFNKLNVLFNIETDKSVKERIDDSLIDGFTHLLTFYS